MSRTAWLIVSLVALNLVLMAFGRGRGKTTDCDADLCIGLVFDVGGLGDKSFNDAAYRGLTQARDELGAEIHYIEPANSSDRESALRQFAAEDYDLVIGVGFIFSDDVRQLATEFPGIDFACVDYSPKPDEVAADNVLGLRFREHEGSFLVGAIAALESKSKKVGFVGGMDIPLIHKFEAGYRAGAKAVCPDCQVISTYAGTTPEAFADPVMGRELALTQYNRGVDIIYHASGKTGAGVFNAAKETKNRAIGVDSDQFDDAPCCVLTSMVKQVDVAVFDAVVQVSRDAFAGGMRELGLKQGGVGFIYDDNNRDQISTETLSVVESLRNQIVTGQIVVPFE